MSYYGGFGQPFGGGGGYGLGMDGYQRAMLNAFQSYGGNVPMGQGLGQQMRGPQFGGPPGPQGMPPPWMAPPQYTPNQLMALDAGSMSRAGAFSRPPPPWMMPQGGPMQTWDYMGQQGGSPVGQAFAQRIPWMQQGGLGQPQNFGTGTPVSSGFTPMPGPPTSNLNQPQNLGTGLPPGGFGQPSTAPQTWGAPSQRTPPPQTSTWSSQGAPPSLASAMTGFRNAAGLNGGSGSVTQAVRDLRSVAGLPLGGPPQQRFTPVRNEGYRGGPF